MKRLLSWLMVLCMLLSLFPAAAFAEELDVAPAEEAPPVEILETENEPSEAEIVIESEEPEAAPEDTIAVEEPLPEEPIDGEIVVDCAGEAEAPEPEDAVEEIEPEDAEAVVDEKDALVEETAVEDEDLEIELEPDRCVVIPGQVGIDGDLLTGYAEKQLDSQLFHPSIQFFHTPFTSDLQAVKNNGAKLTGVNAVLYGTLKSAIQQVAAGERSSTVFTVPVADLGLAQTSWTAAELGVEAIVINESLNPEVTERIRAIVGLNLDLLIDALVSDCPYELYWYDKTVGTAYESYTYSGTSSYISIQNQMTFSFSVAGEYAAGEYEVDSSYGSTINAAVSRAADIVSSYAGLSAYDKLAAYKNEICNLVSYNSAAVNNNAAYGNPWQLIWVFDGDSSTNVVCEGYSKAFQYLCDMSELGSVTAYTVTGRMAGGTGEGPHMWNLVTMTDGLNYLVDVTNCDAGSVGAPDKLFLAGADSGSVADGYIFAANGDAITYTYSVDSLALYSEDELRVAGGAYDPSSTPEPFHTAIPLTLGETTTAEITEPDGALTFSFTPDEDGWYSFELRSDLYFRYAFYDCNWEAMENSSSSWIRTRHQLTADEPFYLVLSFTDSSATGSIDVSVSAAEPSSYEFSTAEELYPLLSRSYDDWVTINYTGADDLTLTGDLVIPNHVTLQTWSNGRIIIPAGSSLTVEESACFYADLTVDGSFVNNGEFSANDVDGTGSFTNNGRGFLQSDISDLSAADEKVAAAQAYGLIAKLRMSLSENYTIGQDFTLPQSARLELNGGGTLIVAEGATLTLEGVLETYTHIRVDGTLVNCDSIYVGGYNQASITLGVNGSYSGSGVIVVSAECDRSLEEFLIGFDLSSFMYQENQPGYWAIRYLDPASVVTLVLNETSSGEITLPGGTVTFRFTPDEDGWYEFSGTTQSAPGLYADLLDSDGNRLDSCGGQPLSVKHELLAGITYYLNVSFQSFSPDPCTATGSVDMTVGVAEQTEFFFTDMDELREICARSYEDTASAYYSANSSSFTITEDLVIPDNLNISFHYHGDTSVLIPEGVTVISRGAVSAHEFIIDGCAEFYGISNEHIYFPCDCDNLTVNGSLTLYEMMTVRSTLVGRENLRFAQRGELRFLCNPLSFADAQAFLARAAADSDEHFSYECNVEPGSGTLLVDQDLTVPGNATFNTYQSTIHLAAGAHLTVDGAMGVWFDGNLIVEGDLEVNGHIYVQADENAVFRFEGGSFCGDGWIELNAPDIADEDALSAFLNIDLSVFSNVRHRGREWFLGNLNAGPGDLTFFSTLDELREYCSRSYDEVLELYYDSEDSLTITEDLVIPDLLFVNFFYYGGVTVSIPEGVTLVSNGSFSAETLIIDGSADIYGISTEDSFWPCNARNLTVNGSMTLHNMMSVDQVSGRENILFVQNGGLRFTCEPGSNAEVTEFLARAEADSDVHYTYECNVNPEIGTLVIDQDLYVPANASLNAYLATIRIASGAKLTADGSMGLWYNGHLIVEGELESNENIYVNVNDGASLRFEGGTYSGTGWITLNAPDIADEDALSAFLNADLSMFEDVRRDGSEWVLGHIGSGPMGDGFTTLAELKDILAAQSEGDPMIVVYYSGSDPFVIDEDLSVPGNVNLIITNNSLTIAQGASVTVENGGFLQVDDLRVDGTLTIDGSVYVVSALCVDGLLMVNGGIRVPGGSFVPTEKMQTGEHGVYITEFEVTSEDELAGVVANADACTDEHIQYQIYVADDIVLSDDLIIPDKAFLYVAFRSGVGSLTVPVGVTLTNGGYIGCSGYKGEGDLTVAGTLVNNAQIGLWSRARLLVTGSYEGQGTLTSDLGTAPEDVIIGLDLSKFERTEEGNQWLLHLIPVSKPVIVEQPESVAAEVGETVCFTVEAEGVGLSYQWYVKVPGSSTWTRVSGGGAKTNTLTLTASEELDGNSYRCRITNEAGIVNSATVTLTIASISTPEPLVQRTVHSFAELKEVLSEYDGNPMDIYYDGSEEFVIEEDLTIPENVYFCCDAEYSVLRIPAGVTLTMEGPIYAYELINDGLILSPNDLEIPSVIFRGAGQIRNSYGDPIVLFSDMEGLHEICAQSWPAVAFAQYTGYDGFFEISEDLEIPANLLVNFNARASTTLTVPAGVTLVSHGTIVADVIHIDGSTELDVIVTEGGIYPNECIELNVNGSLTLYNMICVQQVSGRENIRFAQSGELHIMLYPQRDDEIDAFFTLAAEDSAEHYIYECTAAEDLGSLLIERDITIPANGCFWSYAPSVQLAAGARLTVNGSMDFWHESHLLVDGTIENNGIICLWEDSRLTVSGTYEGFGEMIGSLDRSPEDIIIGLDLSKFECTEEGDQWLLRLIPVSKPVIVEQPESVAAEVGETVCFTVEAEGVGLSYQWYVKVPGGSTWTRVSGGGAKTNTLTLTASEELDGNSYRCRITNEAGIVNSATVTLTIASISKPEIVSQTHDVKAKLNSEVEMTVEASGEDLQYQWYYKSPTGSWKATTLTGAQTETLIVPATASRDGFSYYCVVSNLAGSVPSEPILLTVVLKPVITAQPEDAAAKKRAMVSFTVEAEGIDLEYQWYFKTADGSTWKKSTAESAKEATLELEVTSSRNGNSYRCKVSTISGTVTSAEATLTMITKPVVVTPPADVTVKSGEDAVFTVEAEGYDLSYQWYFKAPGSSTWKKCSVASAATATLTLTADAKKDGNIYRCKVMNAAGSVNSGEAVLTVITKPVIVTQPESVTANAGETVSFTVEARGGNLTYQWYVQEPGGSWKKSYASGAQTATLTLEATAARSGNGYRCKVMNEAGSLNSDTAVLTVN